ncbi:MAG: DUF501 domain-containing protein [Actinomycetota bacterium]
MDSEPLRAGDMEIAEKQLGRAVRGDARVAARCPYGVVEVIATPPLLPDGTPFPTLYWLSCPLLRRRVSGLENAGFRGLLRCRLEEEPSFAEGLRRAEAEYIAAREKWAEEMRAAEETREYFAGHEGVGGTVAGGLKCLHAHLAHHLAGGVNPAGAAVSEALSGSQERECDGDCGPFLREDARR